MAVCGYKTISVLFLAINLLLCLWVCFNFFNDPMKMLVVEEFPIFHVSSSYFICICQWGQRKEVISLEVCLKKLCQNMLFCFILWPCENYAAFYEALNFNVRFSRMFRLQT